MRALSLLPILLSCLALVGCGPSAEEIRFNQDEKWKLDLAIEIHEASMRMWQCTTEIYATRKSGGPVCRDACAKYAAFIEKEKHPPSYVRDLNVEVTEMPTNVCKP